MNHIELFSGCGGLALGLETAGFNLLVANELSPMASETFAYNHLNADLENQKNIDKVFWVSSEYQRSDIKSRLRENPYNATGLRHYSDLLELKPDNKQLNRSLLIGSIIDINDILKKESWLLESLRSGLGNGSVDLVSGGPPCQSFSMAGTRDRTHHRNGLPWEFTKFVENVRPKVALLENVSGILRAFKTETGEQFYAWFEVAKAFAKVGYIPLCLHVNARNTGTAQNRRRFILIGLRRDVYEAIRENSSDQLLLDALNPSKKFFDRVNNDEDPEYGSLSYYEIGGEHDLFESSLFSVFASHKNKVVSVKDAIDDLRSDNIRESDYVKRINGEYCMHHDHRPNKQKNHDLRRNSDKVRARFRLYQIMSKLPKDQSKEISKYLRTGGESFIKDITLKSLESHWMLDTNGEKHIKPSTSQALEILRQLYTKKHTQRALIANEPAPATLSIPDDACHYHESEKMQRTLTVREMARIQSFPDWFQIKSKVTTGGQKRRFQVPQYTQVGNAVPPLLGVALGNVCKELIEIAGID